MQASGGGGKQGGTAMLQPFASKSPHTSVSIVLSTDCMCSTLADAIGLPQPGLQRVAMYETWQSASFLQPNEACSATVRDCWIAA
jgi:hypothetical protein